MDTSRDYRVLVAEDALCRLESLIRSWSLPYPLNKNAALSIVSEIRSLLMKIKYSFLPASMIVKSQELRGIEERVLRLRQMLVPRTQVMGLQVKQRLRLAEAKYALSILLGLRGRLVLGEENKPENAIDVVGVRVTSVEKHPSLENLLVTRASTGRIVLNIVTNIKNLRREEVRGAAILPPQVFDDIVSEAMYATDPLPEEYLGKRIPGDLLSSEVRAAVMRIVRGR